jgi:hypothetical protein
MKTTNRDIIQVTKSTGTVRLSGIRTSGNGDVALANDESAAIVANTGVE